MLVGDFWGVVIEEVDIALEESILKKERKGGVF
jgi:hypothetical protein